MIVDVERAQAIFRNMSGCFECPAKKLCGTYIGTGDDPDCVDIIAEWLTEEGNT